MASRKYRVRSTDELAEEFKRKAAIFNRNLRGLEDKAKKCESLKWVDTQSASTVLSKGHDDKYLLDWQPYLNDGKRKLSRTLTKLKEIQNHRKQRRISFIGSVKEALPFWAKKKGPGKYLQLQQLISDTEDYEALISDIVQQINSAEELSNLVNKITQQRDSNQNDQLTKELHDLTGRWNSLNLTVINKSNSLESLGLEVDNEYRKLNEWYQKCDTFSPWLDSSEKVISEDTSTQETTIPAIKEKLSAIQDQIKECEARKPQVTEINSEAYVLLNSGRLDQGDTERVQKLNESLSTRYTTITDKLVETQSKLYGNIHQLKKKPEGKIESNIVEDSVKPNHKSPAKIITPFHKPKDEESNNEHKINDSMKAVKRMLEGAGNRTSTERDTDKIHEESVKAFEASLDTCEKALNELDDESLHKFSSVGSTISEVREQLDDIQVLEQNMEQEDNNFSVVKETFDESENKHLIKEESRARLRRKVDDLHSRWEEMWRSHDANKNRLVQGILIMGGQWMANVNHSLDELEESMKSTEIQEDDLEALREEEKRHKEIMNKIIAREDAVSGAVDVAREVHRRDLVTDETGKTIEHETQGLEDRLERLIGEAEEKKKRISSALREVEQASTVDETMVASSVIAVHSEPDDSQADEGFSEPKQGLFKRKLTYESLISQKIKEFEKETQSMNEWMDETERLVKSLSVDMDPKKATKIQQKINTRYAQIQEKQSKVDRIVRLSKEIENETLDPTVSEPILKEADEVKERWSKDKEMMENYGENDVGSKAATANCCYNFLKIRLFPAWSYN